MYPSWRVLRSTLYRFHVYLLEYVMRSYYASYSLKIFLNEEAKAMSAHFIHCLLGRNQVIGHSELALADIC